jgi:predicted DCC family thiol-disulfide oxidoreductase YuxK
MKALTVLYDAQCGFCVKCRWWLVNQPKFVAMDFLPAGGPEAARRFPELAGEDTAEELTVVDDEGGVYRGTRAWILCLWALRDYREWSLRLATPGLLPFARGAFALVSASRKKLSSWLRLATEAEIARELRTSEPPRCVDGP